MNTVVGVRRRPVRTQTAGTSILGACAGRARARSADARLRGLPGARRRGRNRGRNRGPHCADSRLVIAWSAAFAAACGSLPSSTGVRKSWVIGFGACSTLPQFGRNGV